MPPTSIRARAALPVMPPIESAPSWHGSSTAPKPAKTTSTQRAPPGSDGEVLEGPPSGPSSPGGQPEAAHGRGIPGPPVSSSRPKPAKTVSMLRALSRLDGEVNGGPSACLPSPGDQREHPRDPGDLNVQVQALASKRSLSGPSLPYTAVVFAGSSRIGTCPLTYMSSWRTHDPPCRRR